MEERLEFLIKIVRQAGKIALSHFDKGDKLSITEKQAQDYVSEGDLEVEKFLVSKLSEKFPEDHILGEEGISPKQANTSLEKFEQGSWIIDPIDGTTNFISGFHYWGISVAYYKHGEVRLGCIYAPAIDKFFHVRQHAGFYLNDVSVTAKSASKKRLHEIKPIIGLGLGYKMEARETLDLLEYIKGLSFDYRKLSCCSLMLADTALGNFTAYYEPQIHSWDCAAGILMVLESGGSCSDFFSATGRGLIHGKPLLAAVDATFYARLTPLLQRIFPT